MTVLVRYDSEADATYVELEPEATPARTVELLDAHLLVDVDEAGHPNGIELLCRPGDVDRTTFTALAERFPDLDIDALQTALAGTRSTTA